MRAELHPAVDHYPKDTTMKRFTSAFLLATLLVTGGAAAANAAPAKSSVVAPVSSVDRINNWPG